MFKLIFFSVVGMIFAFIVWGMYRESRKPTPPKEKKRRAKGNARFLKQLDDSGVVKVR